MSLLERLFSENYVHVIDDFYEDLSWLDEHLKTAEFFVPPGINYSGLTSRPPADISYAKNKIWDILGNTLTFDEFDGQIRLIKEADRGSEKTFVHIDHERVTVLIYLSDPPPHLTALECGTSFYSHKMMKKTRLLNLDVIKKNFQNDIILRDTKSMDLWEKWLTIPMKKNRAIIFDGHLYHSPPDQFFGDQIFNSRLTQNFFPKLPTK